MDEEEKPKRNPVTAGGVLLGAVIGGVVAWFAKSYVDSVTSAGAGALTSVLLPSGVSSLKKLDDSTFASFVSSGQPSAVVLMAPAWCGICKTEMPVLQQAARNGVNVAWVDYDDANAKVVVQQMNQTSVPTTFYYRGGKAKFYRPGAVSEAQLRSDLASTASAA